MKKTLTLLTLLSLIFLFSIIEQTFTVHNDSFSIVKKVKYKDADNYFIRHEFAFERVK